MQQTIALTDGSTMTLDPEMIAQAGKATEALTYILTDLCENYGLMVDELTPYTLLDNVRVVDGFVCIYGSPITDDKRIIKLLAALEVVGQLQEVKIS
jgi:hypothetical protein